MSRLWMGQQSKKEEAVGLDWSEDLVWVSSHRAKGEGALGSLTEVCSIKLQKGPGTGRPA